MAYTLTQAVEEMDLVHAQLLTDVVYRVHDSAPILGSFAGIEPAMQERITFLLGGRYEGLRAWLGARADERRKTNNEGRLPRYPSPSSLVVRHSSNLDHFLARLFGELLSQPGYGFHGNFSAGEVTTNVIESVRKFRQVIARAAGGAHSFESNHTSYRRPLTSRLQAGKEAIARAGIYRSCPGGRRRGAVRTQLAAAADRRRTPGAGLHLPDVQSACRAPVLARRGEQRLVGAAQPAADAALCVEPHLAAGTQWIDLDEYAARQEALHWLALGLVRRCRTKIHLGLSGLGEQGIDQRGPLLRAIQRVLRET